MPKECVAPLDYSQSAHLLASPSSLLPPKLAGEVAETVARRLANSQNAEISRLNCEICGRVLILRGCVSSYYVKQMAQETIRTQAGKHRIVNRLEVHYQEVPESDFSFEREGVR